MRVEGRFAATYEVIHGMRGRGYNLSDRFNEVEKSIVPFC